MDTFRFLGSTVSWYLKWTSHIDIVRKKPQAVIGCTSYESLKVQHVSGVADHPLNCYHSVCPHGSVWFGLATKQDRNRITDNRICTEDHHGLLALYPGLVDGQEMGKYHLCGSLTNWLTVSSPPLLYVLQSTVSRKHVTQRQFLLQGCCPVELLPVIEHQ